MLSLAEFESRLPEMATERSLFAQPVDLPRTAKTLAQVGASAGIHAIVLLMVMVVMTVYQPPVRRPVLIWPRQPSVVYVPVMPVALPIERVAMLAAPTAVDAIEPAPEKPLVPVKPIETVAEASPVFEPVPPTLEVPRPSLKPAAPVTPTVGVFPSAASAVRAAEPTARVENAGFDAPIRRTVESKAVPLEVGGFESARQTAAALPTGRDIVADSGFGRPAAARVPSESGRVIRDTGFGNTAERQQPKVAVSTPDVKPSGFDNVVTANKPRGTAPPPPVSTRVPVEVLFKPTPLYTEEGRTRRIEGEVLLEVDFLASGSIRVIRVVRGLGHGLDEAAVTAAEQIRFKPALEGGRAVDMRATVNIVFRLA